jgi:hypothetical protein
MKVEQFRGTGDGQDAGTLRALGVREVGQGMDILMHADPTPGLWARVAGDVLDMAAMGYAVGRTRRPKSFAIAALAVLAIGAVDLLVATRLSSRR